MSNKYIFLTDDIHTIGGEQLYVAGKSAYLSKKGWDVKIIFPGINKGACEIPSLQQYVSGGIRGIWRAPFKWGSPLCHLVLCRMKKIVGDCAGSAVVLIESNTGELSQWGELLASEIGARHICMICNETFRGQGKTYNQMIDFFGFKLDRQELSGIDKKSLRLLFSGYRDVTPEESRSFYAAEMPPVQDVRDERLSLIRSDADWTICHVGRAEKDYVEFAIQGMSEFAKRHCERHIQIVFVGETGCRRDQINSQLRTLDNVNVVEMGNMVPIPRSLYSCVDVVIASSGCALFSACEGVATIVADAENNKSNGVLGVDTDDFIFHEDGALQEEYIDTLERVLCRGLLKPPTITVPSNNNNDIVYEKQIIDAINLRSPYGVYGTTMLLNQRASLDDRLRSLFNAARLLFSFNEV